MPIVCDAENLKVREVKNLGWLLHHWAEVKEFEVRRLPNAMWPFYLADGIMAARLLDGHVYVCHWADLTVCKDWLHRPVFRGAPLYWIDHWTVC